MSVRRVEVEVDAAGRFRDGRVSVREEGIARPAHGLSGAVPATLAEVLLLGGVSAALWNAALLAAGALLAENVQDLVVLFERYTRVAAIGLVACAVAAGAWLLLRRAVRGERR